MISLNGSNANLLASKLEDNDLDEELNQSVWQISLENFEI